MERIVLEAHDEIGGTKIDIAVKESATNEQLVQTTTLLSGLVPNSIFARVGEDFNGTTRISQATAASQEAPKVQFPAAGSVS